MKSRPVVRFICWLMFVVQLVPWSEAHGQNDSLEYEFDFTKKPMIAASEVFMVNLIINRYDAWYFRDGGEYWAKVTPASWKSNLTHGLEWDWNSFYANWFGHPIHGSLYFNAARSLGMTYWEAVPYSYLGSFVWEYFGETHPPSGNDLMTTSIGGIFLGEITHRLSHKLLDYPANGLGRAWRVALSTLINPMRTINKLAFGTPRNSLSAYGADQTLQDIRAYISAGQNFQVRSLNIDTRGSGLFLEFGIVYGNLHDEPHFYKPFEFFDLRSWLRFVDTDIRPSPFVNITAHGILWGQNLKRSPEYSLVIGAFQHFDFLNDEVIEIGSLGFSGGFILNQKIGQDINMYYQTHIGPTVLGGSNNEIVGLFADDHESVRDYILGPGFLIKTEILMDHKTYGRLSFDYKHFTFYVQSGPDGVEGLNLITLTYSLPFLKSYRIGANYARYYRRVVYDHYPEYDGFKKDLYELRAYLTYEF